MPAKKREGRRQWHRIGEARQVQEPGCLPVGKRRCNPRCHVARQTRGRALIGWRGSLDHEPTMGREPQLR